MEWPLFAGVPAEDVRRLLSIARRRTFRKGEIVFHRDDLAESLLLVVSGRFAVRITTPLGDSALLDVLGPGDVFGELALLLPDARRSASVEALEPGETFSVFRDDFVRLQSEHPGVKDVLLRLLAEQLARASDRIVEAHYVDAETRVRRRLCELASDTRPAKAGPSCRSPRRTWPAWPGRRAQRSTACSATKRSGASSSSHVDGRSSAT